MNTSLPSSQSHGKHAAVIIFVASFILVMTLMWADYITDPGIDFAVFYLIPIAFATWYAGPWYGGILALIGSVAWCLEETLWATHYSTPIIFYWNASARLIIFGSAVGMVEAAKRSRQKVEQKVKERTASLAEEIAVRKQTEEHLQIERDFAQSVINTAQAIVLVLDAEGRIIRFNPYFEEISGYRMEEVLGKDWFSTFLPADDQKPTRELFTTAVKGIQTRGNINPILTKDGRKLQIEWYDKPLCDTEGNLIGLLCIGHDITENLHADEEMKWKTALLEAQLNATTAGILIIDKKGQKLIQNQRLNELFEIPEQLVQNKDDAPQLEFVKNKTTNPEAFIEKINYLYSHPNEISNDEITLNNGKVLERYSAPVIGEDGTHFGRIWLFHDITERKDAEKNLQEMQTLLNEVGSIAKIGGWKMDIATRQATWTLGTHEIVEIPPDEPVPGMDKHANYYLPEYRAIVTESIRALIEENKPLDFEAPIKTAKGNIKWCHALGKAVHKDGEVVEISGTFQDVTEQKSANARRALFTKVLAMLNRENNISQLMKNIIDLIKKEFDIEGIGLRLCEEGAFPYYDSQESSTEFIKSSRTPYILDRNGKPCRDSNGQLMLSCLCGEVLHGKTDPTLPVFTPGGSFWTNDLGKSLEDLQEKDFKVNLRKHCVSDGYESMALVPLRSGNKTIGLLHLHDHRKGIFSPEKIQFFEELGSSIGIALSRKSAAEKLRTSQQLIEGIINAIPARVFWKDNNLVFMGCNTMFAHDAGFEDPKDIIGKDDYQMNWRDHAESYRADDRQVIESGSPKRLIEEVQTTPDGKTITVLTNKVPLRDAKGEIVGVLGTYMDITERKRAENALEALSRRQEAILSAVPDIIMETDANKIYTWANAAGFSFFGNDVIGKEVSDYFVGEQNTYENVQPVFNGYEKALYIESWQRRKDGEERLLAWWCRSLKDEHGNIVGALSTARDITEFQLAEEERVNLEAQLYQAQKMESVGRLAGGVAHDFNNILTGIMGYADLGLENIDENTALKEYLQEIDRLAERAADLTRQLLAFSRRQPLMMKVLNLNNVIGNASKMLKRLIGEDIDLQFIPGANIGNIRADAGQMEQVLMNLAVNARDAMPGGGKLTIETMNVEIDEEYAKRHAAVIPGPYVMLAVSDTGQGMDEDTKTHLFDPFFTTKEKSKGTGLGLATVYGIVKQHGGNIWVYSEPGQGACFKIYLPQSTEEVNDTESKAKPKSDGRGETILVVEDEASVRMLTERILTTHGYTVFTAESAEEALDVFRKNQKNISMLLTDVVLPGMNGRKLYETINQDHSHTKVLYMSGYTDNAIVHQGILDPGVFFMQKPFTTETITSMVRQVLDS